MDLPPSWLYFRSCRLPYRTHDIGLFEIVVKYIRKDISASSTCVNRSSIEKIQNTYISHHTVVCGLDVGLSSCFGQRVRASRERQAAPSVGTVRYGRYCVYPLLSFRSRLSKGTRTGTQVLRHSGTLNCARVRGILCEETVALQYEYRTSTYYSYSYEYEYHLCFFFYQHLTRFPFPGKPGKTIKQTRENKAFVIPGRISAPHVCSCSYEYEYSYGA